MIAAKDSAIAFACWAVIPFPMAPPTAFARAPTKPIVGAFSARLIKPRPILCAVELMPCPGPVPAPVGPPVVEPPEGPPEGPPPSPPPPSPAVGTVGAAGTPGACVPPLPASASGVVGVVRVVGVVGAVVEPVNSVYPEGIGN